MNLPECSACCKNRKAETDRGAIYDNLDSLKYIIKHPKETPLAKFFRIIIEVAFLDSETFAFYIEGATGIEILRRIASRGVKRAMPVRMFETVKPTRRRCRFAALLLFFAFLTPARAVESVGLNPNEDWLVASNPAEVDSSALSGTSSVGRVTRIDATNVETEDRVAKVETRFGRPQGGAVLLKPQPAPADVEKRVVAIRKTRRRFDYVWLRNGDEFPCEFFALDKRFAYLRAFDVDVKIPRGRVAAIRFRDVSDDKINDQP